MIADTIVEVCLRFLGIFTFIHLCVLRNLAGCHRGRQIQRAWSCVVKYQPTACWNGLCQLGRPGVGVTFVCAHLAIPHPGSEGWAFARRWSESAIWSSVQYLLHRRRGTKCGISYLLGLLVMGRETSEWFEISFSGEPDHFNINIALATATFIIFHRVALSIDLHTKIYSVGLTISLGGQPMYLRASAVIRSVVLVAISDRNKCSVM